LKKSADHNFFLIADASKMAAQVGKTRLQKRFSVCVDGVLVRDGKIFLLKRNVEPFKGYWHVVGGQVEDDETLKEALKREFKEETSLDVEIGKVVGGRIEQTFDRTKLIVVFSIVDAQGEIKINGESGEFGWFSEMPEKSVYDYSNYLP
jgi:ADP-ribose pyrophosphatase YjhB (NUDIX family)